MRSAITAQSKLPSEEAPRLGTRGAGSQIRMLPPVAQGGNQARGMTSAAGDDASSDDDMVDAAALELWRSELATAASPAREAGKQPAKAATAELDGSEGATSSVTWPAHAIPITNQSGQVLALTPGTERSHLLSFL